jgi:glyoxylate reductase
MSGTQPAIIVSAPLSADDRRRLNGTHALVDAPTDNVDPEWLSTQTGIRGWLVTARQQIRAEHLYAVPQLQAVSTVAVGYDNIDLAAASQRGVRVFNTPDVLDATVAELAITLILALARGITDADRYVRSGQWHRHGPFALRTSVHGSTVGVLGMGRIGARIAAHALALGANILYHNRTRSVSAPDGVVYCPRDELFGRADYVVVTLPCTDGTRGSIGDVEFAMMKATAAIVNISRGAVIRQDELVHALRSGAIAGAALDVMTTEPLPADDALCHLPGVLLTPHIGSATAQTRQAMTDMAVTGLIADLAGQPTRKPVNADAVLPKHL